MSSSNDRKPLDQGGENVALLTDLSKAFDCLPHDLTLVKLCAYRFDKASLGLIHSYLIDRYQRGENKSMFCFKFFVALSDRGDALSVTNLFISLSFPKRKSKIVFSEDCFDAWMILVYG